MNPRFFEFPFTIFSRTFFITVQNKFTNLLESKTRATTLLSVIGHAAANSCVETVCFLDVCPGRSLFFVLAVENPRSSHVILFKKAEREK
jgi:hypothetical protein